MKEKLIVTAEFEDFPENAKILDFQIVIIENGFWSKIFTGYKKIKIIKVPITKMEVEK